MTIAFPADTAPLFPPPVAPPPPSDPTTDDVTAAPVEEPSLAVTDIDETDESLPTEEEELEEDLAAAEDDAADSLPDPAELAAAATDTTTPIGTFLDITA